MFIRKPRSSNRAWTLVEMMVAVGLFSVAGIALGAMYLYSIKSFASMANYAMLDRENREAMDLLSRELRQARFVTSYSSNALGNNLSVRIGDGTEVTYAFDLKDKKLIRQSGGQSRTLLTNCNLLNFSLFQRNPSSNSYGLFPVAANNWTQEVKVVQLTWRTARQVPSGPINSENIQTARVVIRKQQQN